jgi:transposase-like protein
MASHRKFDPEFKARVVLEVLTGAKTAAEVCREYQLKPDLFSKWKAQFVHNAGKVFQSGEVVDPAQVQVAELERLVGRLTVELEAAKKVSTLLRSLPNKSAP